MTHHQFIKIVIILSVFFLLAKYIDINKWTVLALIKINE